MVSCVHVRPPASSLPDLKLKDTWTGKGAREFFDRSYWRLKQELDDSEETLVAMRDDLQAFYESYKTWDQQTAGSIAGKET